MDENSDCEVDDGENEIELIDEQRSFYIVVSKSKKDNNEFAIKYHLPFNLRVILKINAGN